MKVADEFVGLVHRLHALRDGQVTIFKRNGRLLFFNIDKRILTEFEVAQLEGEKNGKTKPKGV